MSALGSSIEIEVAYADAEQQILATFALPAPVTIQDALDAARHDERFASVHVATHSCGVFGRLVPRERYSQHTLSQGDRVELYRELVVDAKTARLLRAAEQKRK